MRKTFHLDQDWRFQTETETRQSASHSAAYSAAKAGGAQGAAAPDFDDGSWRVVNLPHDYGSEGRFREENSISGGYRDRGVAWYRRSFCLPESDRGKQVFLVFEGISVFAEVFFNGSLMAHSFSGSIPVSLDLTDRARFGDDSNLLAVRVDGTPSEGWWYQGAGIYRHVKLYIKEPLHIAHEGLWIKPVCQDLEKGIWQANCEVTFENSSDVERAGEWKVTLLDHENNPVAEASAAVTCQAYERKTASAILSMQNPHLWSPERPYLYTVCASVSVGKQIDEAQTRIGFRHFSADPDHGFFLNGKPIKLKGVCNHQDHAGVGIAVPDAIQYERIRQLKEMGCNAYRCAHHLHAPEILDACDELGLLVMDENRQFESDAEHLAHYEAMVKRDRNHPCVVFYSVFNEEPLQGTPEGQKMFRRIAHRIRELDDTRLITGAMNGGYREKNGTAAAMDVIGLNYKIRERATEVHTLFPKQPVYGSENNSVTSTRGCYKTDLEKHILNCYDEEVVPWGQSIRDTWDFVRSTEWFGGIFIWTGHDYLGEPTPFEWPSVGSQFGLLDRCGFPKDGYYQCKACFDDSPMVWITPHWNWKEGETVRVMVTSNCEETELFLNGKSLGKKPSDCCAPAEWSVPFVPGTLSAIGYRSGVAVAKTERKTAGRAAKIVLEPSRAELLNDGNDALAVNLSIVDENGTVLETDSRKLSLEIIGDGVLLGVGNGDPNRHEDDHIPECCLYAGHAQMIVGSTVGGKALTVRASAEELPDSELQITVRQGSVRPTLVPSRKRFVRNLSVSAETYSEKPDACMEIADNDMNSFEPLALSPNTFLPGFEAGWKLLRTKFEVPDLKSECPVRCAVHFASVCAGEMEVYANGIKALQKENQNCAVTVAFDLPANSVCDLRILLLASPGKSSGVKGTIDLEFREKE